MLELIFVEMANLYNSKMIWACFALVTVHPSRLHLTEYLSTADIKIISTCVCFRHLKVHWSGVLIRYHFLPKDTSVWTDNGLNIIDPQSSHQIYILSRVLDHILDLK